MINNDLSIVVVDDMPLGREAVCIALACGGYRDIRSASSASEALALLAERPADVVLADWVMPEMDGLELTNHIRQQDEAGNHYTSVILFTAKEGVENLVLAFERGVDDYLTKPVNERELAARVHAAGRVAVLQNALFETAQSLFAHNLRLEEMATTDPLTGLGNRRYMRTHLEALMLETATRGGAIYLAIADVDHFKAVNDSYGHAVGDEVLVAVANRLRRAVRPTDVVVRMGGEEFAVIMHCVEVSQCNPAIFERILRTINQRPVKTAAGNLTVTVSLGVCFYNGAEQGPQSVEAILECADTKLYQAKEGGRNRVVF